MPIRHRFYDPIIQTAEEIVAANDHALAEIAPVRGVAVEVPGIYILASDVAAALRTMAADFDGEASEALIAAADSFSGATVDGQPVAAEASVVEVAVEPLDFVKPYELIPAREWPPHPTVARIEMYPNEDASYWYARPVNSEGEILLTEQTVTGINRDLVESVALDRWPGAPMYAITDAMGDSIWDEQTHAFGFNGRRRPSPRRLWT